VIVWNLEGGQIDARLKFDSPDTTAFAVSPDGGLCAVGTSAGGLIVIDMRASAPIHEYQLPEAGGVSGLGFSEDGLTLAVGTSTGKVHLWPIEAEQPATTLEPPGGGEIAEVLFLDDNRLLSLRGQTIDTWDIGAAASKQLAVPLERANALAVDPTGKRAAVGSTEESGIVVLDLKQQKQSATLNVELE
jgi:WD40 repeat protein